MTGASAGGSMSLSLLAPFFLAFPVLHFVSAVVPFGPVLCLLRIVVCN